MRLAFENESNHTGLTPETVEMLCETTRKQNAIISYTFFLLNRDWYKVNVCNILHAPLY